MRYAYTNAHSHMCIIIAEKSAHISIGTSSSAAASATPPFALLSATVNWNRDEGSEGRIRRGGGRQNNAHTPPSIYADKYFISTLPLGDPPAFATTTRGSGLRRRIIEQWKEAHPPRLLNAGDRLTEGQRQQQQMKGDR